MKQRLVLALLLACTCLTTTFAQDKDKQPDKKQCQGITVNGKQCMNVAKPGTNHCYLHNPNKTTCSGLTTKGVRCKRGVAKDGDYCHQHIFQSTAKSNQ